MYACMYACMYARCYVYERMDSRQCCIMVVWGTHQRVYICKYAYSCTCIYYVFVEICTSSRVEYVDVNIHTYIFVCICRRRIYTCAWSKTILQQSTLNTYMRVHIHLITTYMYTYVPGKIHINYFGVLLMWVWINYFGICLGERC